MFWLYSIGEAGLLTLGGLFIVNNKDTSLVGHRYNDLCNMNHFEIKMSQHIFLADSKMNLLSFMKKLYLCMREEVLTFFLLFEYLSFF